MFYINLECFMTETKRHLIFLLIKWELEQKPIKHSLCFISIVETFFLLLKQYTADEVLLIIIGTSVEKQVL